MADIDKLTLEIEDKASKSTDGISKLVEKLTVLDGITSTAAPDIKQLSKSFNSLSKSLSNVNNVDFTKVSGNMNKLKRSLSVFTGSKFVESSNNIKQMASAMNSLNRALTKVNASSSKRIDVNTSKLKQSLGGLGGNVKFLDSGKNIKSMASGVNSLTKSLSRLNTIDINKVSDNIAKLKTSLNSLGDSSKFAESSKNIKLMASAMNSLNRALGKLDSTQKSSKLDLNKMQFNVNKYTKVPSTGLGDPRKARKTSMFNGATDMLSMFYMAERVTDAIQGLWRSTNDYIETLNLFNVAMGENTRKAWDFTQAMENLGANQEQVMKYQASFYDISKSIGLTTKNAYTLSEQFTKLAYDYSSLYNIDVDVAFQKLQAAAVGTVEPIRRLGKDITIAKLQEIAYTLGIEKNVRAMTQAERTELRFIAVMQQSRNAMNDLERTIETPANAIRVLRAQFHSLAREIGNLFIPILKAVLPYLIAITKFIRLIVSGIASFFGLKMGEINFDGVNTQLGTADNLSDKVSDNLGKAGKNAKKLKDYMLGIDELNVLNKDTSSPTGGAGGAGGDIPGIGGGLGLDLEKFGYEELLKSVKTRADEIYDSLVKWKKPILTTLGLLGAAGIIGKLVTMGLKISALGGLAGGVGTIFSTVIGPAILGVTAGLTAALGIFTGMYAVTNDWKTSLAAASSVFIGPFSLGLLAILKGMEPVIEQVDELGEGISDVTRDKLQPMIDTWKQLDTEIVKLDWTDKVITDEDVQSITSKTHSMVEAIDKELHVDMNNSLDSMTEKFKQSGGEIDETEQEMLNRTKKFYEDKIKGTKEAEDEINKIMKTARDQNRDLTEDEVERLRILQNEIRDNAINSMTESQKEQELIMMRLNDNLEALTVEQGSKILQEAIKNHDAQLKEAEDWKYEQLFLLKQQFGENADMSNKEYAKAYNKIQENYDSMVKQADEGYDKINGQVRKALGKQFNDIDETTGKIKTRWQKLTGDIKDLWNKLGKVDWGKAIKDGINKCATSVKNAVTSWFKNNVIDPLKNAWNSFWDNLKPSKNNKWIQGLLQNQGNYSSKPFSLASEMPIRAPKMTAMARGGFVPSNANFVSPNVWTAGEAGREVVGSYRGKATVMPLEDTGFVQAMYRAVYDAVRDGTSSGEPMKIVVQPQVKIGSKDIKQAQEEYDFNNGSMLLRRV